MPNDGSAFSQPGHGRAISVLLSLTLAAAGCGARPAPRETARPQGRPAVPVLVQEAVRKDMPVVLQAFGTVAAAVSVTLQPRVSGVLTQASFQEGQDVSAGDILFQIDPAECQNALQQAEAGLAKNQVLLRNARKENERQRELSQKGLVPQDLFDDAQTAMDALAATVQADEAAVADARLQLGYCTMRAPVAGRTGRRLVDPGNLVKANESPLVTINGIRPVDVSFAVPEQELARLRTATGAAAPDLAVTAALPEAADRAIPGRLTFVDNTVDRTTGTVMLKARFDNEDGRLWPGRFVNVRLELAVETNAVVVPFRAVQNGQQGTYVFVVNPDLTVAVRLVGIARNVGEESILTRGLDGGERVVTDGQQRLGPGTVVHVQDLPAGAPDTRSVGSARGGTGP